MNPYQIQNIPTTLVELIPLSLIGGTPTTIKSAAIDTTYRVSGLIPDIGGTVTGRFDSFGDSVASRESQTMAFGVAHTCPVLYESLGNKDLRVTADADCEITLLVESLRGIAGTVL